LDLAKESNGSSPQGVLGRQLVRRHRCSRAQHVLGAAISSLAVIDAAAISRYSSPSSLHANAAFHLPPLAASSFAVIDSLSRCHGWNQTSDRRSCLLLRTL
jgi:hypothetical protein